MNYKNGQKQKNDCSQMKLRKRMNSFRIHPYFYIY